MRIIEKERPRDLLERTDPDAFREKALGAVTSGKYIRGELVNHRHPDHGSGSMHAKRFLCVDRFLEGSGKGEDVVSADTEVLP